MTAEETARDLVHTWDEMREGEQHYSVMHERPLLSQRYLLANAGLND